jgi:undecaprenyl pyrophosphate phosphatase UppP
MPAFLAPVIAYLASIESFVAVVAGIIVAFVATIQAVTWLIGMIRGKPRYTQVNSFRNRKP